MKVSVQLFAGLRAVCGADQCQLELPDRAPVGAVRRALVARWPGQAGLINASQFAVGPQYVRDDHPLADQDQVACIPPVSGG